MNIITGYLGEPHVAAEQDRDVNIGVVGDGSYVMPAGQRLAAEVQTNNEVRIRDGVLIHQGCAASIKKNTYDTVTIANGSQGMKRIDLIVARYQRNVETGVESLDLTALQGTPAESDPTVPEHTEGDIQAGDAVADMPLYEVEKDGLNITRVTKVFEEVESLSSLNGKTLSYKQIYEGYSGGGYVDIPSISGAHLVCIECVYANVTRGATTIPIEQFKKGYDCYATYGRDSNIWVLAKYSSDTRVGINCGGSGGDVLCRISIL